MLLSQSIKLRVIRCEVCCSTVGKWSFCGDYGLSGLNKVDVIHLIMIVLIGLNASSFIWVCFLSLASALSSFMRLNFSSLFLVLFTNVHFAFCFDTSINFATSRLWSRLSIRAWDSAAHCLSFWWATRVSNTSTITSVGKDARVDSDGKLAVTLSQPTSLTRYQCALPAEWRLRRNSANVDLRPSLDENMVSNVLVRWDWLGWCVEAGALTNTLLS